MIPHILKIIWNERKTNAWIVLEYIVVFCLLWFCIDYLYYMGKSYREPLGYDIEHVYRIRMGQKDDEMEYTEEDWYEYAVTFLNRVRQHPDVESASLSRSGIPYGDSMSANSFVINSDSIREGIRLKWVSSGFFDVFKMRVQGSVFDWRDQAASHQVLLSPDNAGYLGGYSRSKYLLTDVHSVRNEPEDDTYYNVIGTTHKVKDSFFDPYLSVMFLPLERRHLNLSWLQIAVRIRPAAEKGFTERFTRDMSEQLDIGPFFLASISSFEDLKHNMIKFTRTLDNLNSVYAVTTFLIINIFLGLIGTFWYRTQSRRSEIGLRIALGATKRNAKTMMFTETLLLLFVSSLVAVNICVNVGHTELLTTLGLPVAGKTQMSSAVVQGFINYGLTFSFLAIVSLIAVWYPARQASDVPPAEVLREE